MAARAVLIADGGAAAAEPEFFRSPELYAAEGVTHSLRVESGPSVLLVAPLIVRSIEGGLLDAASPYGYPGAKRPSGGELRAREVDWSEAGLVSAFLRDRVGPPSAFVDGTLRSHVMVADPRAPLSIRATHRRHIARNARLGYTIEVVDGPEAGAAGRAAFGSAYRQTMARTNAAERYFFDDAWFERVLRSPASWLVFAVASDGREAAAALVVRSDAMLHYYLGGTGDEFLAHSPFKNVVQAMIDLAAGLGLPLSLGGGVRPGDALEHFKAGFANATAPWYTHEVIADPEAYARLCGEREETGFFPAYRSGG